MQNVATPTLSYGASVSETQVEALVPRTNLEGDTMHPLQRCIEGFFTSTTLLFHANPGSSFGLVVASMT